ncbi:XRE family transcriptional regulator [Streptomyces europaeiscabiei]|uniref:helix-turn-helix domain-containing protein n=1 Tax=Streptomyces europaeiscabiei TaxID=146819 RepID=UPI002E196B45
MTTTAERARVPNDVLTSVRKSMNLSQDEFARGLRDAGEALGEPNDASKRLVQRWESGETRTCRPLYARALKRFTGRAPESLGFAIPMARVHSDGTGGHDMQAGEAGTTDAVASLEPESEPQSEYVGIWLSRYEFYSSSRDETYDCKHHIVIVQHGNRLTAQSLPGASTNPDSPLSLDLTVDRNVVTGTWIEQTAADGYYQGARYHGAIQLLVEPTGRRMAGKWVGFGKDFDVNTGPWELRLLDRSTGRASIERYSTTPE